MAGNGPPPATSHTRTRNDVQRETIKSDGKLGGFDLPDDVLPVDSKTGEREEWHARTVAWWHNWRASPQGVKMMTDPDWDYLLDTALLHHQMWISGGKNSERAAEIRIRVAEFGATPAARLRLRMDIQVPEEFPVGDRGATVTSLDARRAAIMGGSATPG
jgi:hypothetical protein